MVQNPTSEAPQRTPPETPYFGEKSPEASDGFHSDEDEAKIYHLPTQPHLVKLHEKAEKGSLRARVGGLLESRCFEFIILLLVLVDIVLVAGEVGIDQGLFCLDGHISGTEAHAGHEKHHAGHEEAHAGHEASLLGAVRGVPAAEATVLRRGRPALGEQPLRLISTAASLWKHEEQTLMCASPHSEEAEHVLHRLHVGSVIILSVFAAELLLALWVDPTHFIKSRLHLLDLFVVLISLLIDTVVYKYMQDYHPDHNRHERLDIVAGFLVASRAWRVVRLLHGGFEQGHAEVERVHKLELKLVAAEEKLQVAVSERDGARAMRYSPQ